MRATAGTQRSSVEAVVVGVLGATLGGAFGWWLHPWVAVAMAVVAGLNGAVSGWRQGLRVAHTMGRSGLRRRQHVGDAAGGGRPTGAGVCAGHAVGRLRRVAEPSAEPARVPRRRLPAARVRAHPRQRHLQCRRRVARPAAQADHGPRGGARVAGAGIRAAVPGAVPACGRWVGRCSAAVVWVLRRRREPLGKVVESCAYYLNPFEWWAYSRDDLWPPPGLLPGLGWRRAAARPLSAVRAARATRATRARSVDPSG
jgi:hypothetical protein